MSGLPYGYFRETHWISVGFREINMVSLVNIHGPIWPTFETISARNPCRLFQKLISAVRHDRPSTACSHGPLWRTSATIGARNPCRLFQKFISAARHGRPSTARSDELLQQSAPGIRAVCFKSPSRRPVTASRPRPALTNFCNNRRQESVPFVSKVHPSGPSRPAVHGPLWRTSATIGARNPCRLFQKSIKAARHGQPSTARSDELLQQSAPGIRAVCFKSPSRRPVTASRPRPALTNFCNNRRQESVPFVSKVHPSGPSRPAVHGPLWRTSATIGARNPCRLFQKSIQAARHGQPSTARSDELLQQSAPGIRAVCFKSPSKRPVTASHPRPALTNFCNNRRQESVPFVSKVHPGGPSRPAVHGPLWRTSATIGARNPCRLFQKFISAARHGRLSTACSHGPLWRTSATFGARNLCRLFQKSIPAARHGQPSTARPHGPLWWTFATIGVRNPRRLFQKSIPAARHDRPSTARSGWLLKQSAQGSRATCFKCPSQRPVTAVRPRPDPTARSGGLRLD